MITERIAWIGLGMLLGAPLGWCLLGLALLAERQRSDRIVQDVRVRGGL